MARALSKGVTLKNHLRLVASKDERLSKPPRFSRERLLAYGRATPSAFLPFVLVPLRVFRYILYLVMLFLRIPIQVACRVAIVPLLLVAVLWGFVKGWTSTPTLMLAGGAFALFLFSFLYDTVLLLVAPERIYLDT
jgi:hypothetical protein